MGCAFLVAGPGVTPWRARHVERRVRRWERVWSRFRPASELSRLNRRAGRPIRVSRTLLGPLTAALTAARWTDGLVTPTILPALLAAGYDRSFERLPPAVAPRPSPEPAPDAWRAIQVDLGRRTVALPAGVAIDLGGVAKGYAADLLARGQRALLIDAGGDIAVSGPLPNGRPWPIGIADPRAPHETLALLALCRGGVATSGRDIRRWRQGAVERHHLIDPRRGRPAETDVLAATVIGPSALVAEVAAKVVVLRGVEEGARWVERRPALAALIVREDGRVLMTERMDSFLWTAP
jgi:thiamine biosynthesis lipoprotein